MLAIVHTNDMHVTDIEIKNLHQEKHVFDIEVHDGFEMVIQRSGHT